MASWTDKTTPTFNPYVAHQPVEAMAKVGMQKQEQYNQGYQKIQDSIDRVAGLDVVRDVDKLHLQSKLNSLGSDLKSVAAGDFSDFQLTNSVSSMAGNLIEDPDIQNAVISTQKYRQSVSEMQSARKSGKSSPSNEYVFNRDANEWLQGPKESTFNAEYNPYVDVKKEALELLKQLSPSGQISDNAFTQDAQGNLVLNDAVIRTELKGVSPQKIQQALMVGLSPGARRQLQIDGQYKYASAGGEELIQAVGVSSQEQLNGLQSKRSQMVSMLPSARSAAKKAELNAQIGQVDAQIEAVNQSYTSMSQMILENPDSHDSVRAQLETENFLFNFGNAFSYSEISETLESNPYANMAMDRAKLEQSTNLAVARMEQADRHHKDDMFMEGLKLQTAQDKLAFEMSQGGTAGGGTPRELRKSEVEYPTYHKIKGQVDSFDTSILASKNSFLQTTGKDEQWYQVQYAQYLQNPSKVDGHIKDHFDNLSEMVALNKSNKMMLVKIDEKAQLEYPDENKIVQGVLNSLPENTAISTPYGVANYSPEDILEFNNIFNDYIKVEATVGGPIIDYLDDKANDELGPKEIILYEIYKKGGAGSGGNYTKGMDPGEKMIYSMFKTLNKDVAPEVRRIAKEKREYKEQLMKESTVVSQGMDYTVLANKPEQRERLGNLISSMVEIAETPGGLAESPDFNLETAQALITDNELSGTIFVTDPTDYAQGMYKIKAVGKDGATVEFKLPQNIVKSQFGNRFDAAPETSFANKIDQQIKRMNLGKNGSTAMSLSGGDTNPANSFLAPKDFANVSLYGVSANVVSMDGQNYYIRVNIQDPQNPGVKFNDIQLNDNPLRRDQLLYTISNLRDDVIFQMLHNAPPTQEAMKALEDTVKDNNKK